MVQISTPGVTPNRGMGPPVRRFLSNYFDFLLLEAAVLQLPGSHCDQPVYSRASPRANVSR